MEHQKAKSLLRRAEPTVAVRALLRDLPTLSETEVLARLVELGLLREGVVL